MKEFIIKFKGREFDYSCSEAILHAADEFYDLRLDENCFKMVAPFSGGFLTEDVCGILTASLTVLGIIYTDGVAHKSDILALATKEYITRFKNELKSTNCFNLKEMFRDDVSGCLGIIIKGGTILEEIIEKYGKR